MHSLMVVDDEFNIRDGLVNAVPWHTIGVEVVAEARDGLEALDQARKFHPEVVVTDISMDEMNGLEFAEVLLRERPATKIIILSGYGEFAYAQRAIHLRVFAYLLKPVSPEELLAQVAQALKTLEDEPAAPDAAALTGRAVIRRAQEYLEAYYADQETSLDTLAEHLGLTPAYLSKLFKSETGRNYSEALADLRIDRAKHLLLTTNLRSSEVGDRVGYSNPQYFATAFRKATGHSPSEFRELHP
jgi:two-component system response regulator YesN